MWPTFQKAKSDRGEVWKGGKQFLVLSYAKLQKKPAYPSASVSHLKELVGRFVSHCMSVLKSQAKCLQDEQLNQKGLFPMSMES